MKINASHVSSAAMLPINSLHVPQAYPSNTYKVEDDILRNSIQLTGIQQPLIVALLSDKEYIVIDGVRRRRIAASLGIEEVPCVIDQIPEGGDDIEYRNRIRFIIDEHRQDLLPTQRAALIERLKSMFDMSAKDVAAFLGVTPGTITNWTLIDKFIPEVQDAIDSETITIHAARAFAGLKENGQRKIWENYAKDIQQMKGGRFHRFMRDTYPPDQFSEMYKAPKVIERRLKRGTQTRKAHKRAKVSMREKDMFLRDVDTKRIELEDKKSRIKELEQHIEAAISVIEQLMEHPDIWKSLPKTMREDFDNFAERNI